MIRTLTTAIVFIIAACASAFAESFIEIETQVIELRAGRKVEIALQNRSSEINLMRYPCRWSLLADLDLLDSGLAGLDLAPGRRGKLIIRNPLDTLDPDAEYRLLLEWLDRDRVIQRNLIWLRPDGWSRNFIMRMRGLEWDEGWTATSDIEATRIDHNLFVFESGMNNHWRMVLHEGNTRLITAGPQFHLSAADGSSGKMAKINTLSRNVQRRGPDIEIQTRIAIEIDSASPTVEARIDLNASPWGFIDARLELEEPERWPDGYTLDVSLTLPHTLDRIGWMGGSAPGFHPLKSFEASAGQWQPDMYLLAAANGQGAGIGLAAWSEDMRWDGDGAGRRLLIRWIGESAGRVLRFRIVPLESGDSIRLFEPLFGPKKSHTDNLALPAKES